MNSSNVTAIDVMNTQIFQSNNNIIVEISQILNNAYTGTLNKQNHEGNTPLHFACVRRHYAECNLVKKLLEQPNLLLNVRNNKGRTPFHDACFHSYPWLVRTLTEHPGVNINMIDDGGENALHHIIQGYIRNPINDPCLETIHYLLKSNPFLVIQNNPYGESPLDYVYKWNINRGGHQMLSMNGKFQGYHCQTLDREFWKILQTTLEYYRTEARLRMVNYFMECTV
jgi:ankyrin repeat protein